ncbi:cyclin-domain-containing protein, partial [Punctularia strigosozonata HHB-11173 SS5]|uniref:cyclin-domain-containing protein n=1 Tax=Punctularia strigosozonata (strain HHB-11173) TaxID=741275 RepID=UPI00044186EA
LTFHARNIPTISLEAYLLRILKYCPTTNEVFLSLLVYFDRMARLSKEATGRTFVIDSFNIHRLVIAGVTVASKFFSDVFYTNSRYAKVGGLPQAELNSLELQFLLLNNFELMVSPEEMQKYAEDLVFFSQTQQPSSAISSSSSSSSTTTTTSAPVLPSPSSADPPSPSTPAIPAAPAADQSHLKTPHVRPATAGYQRKDSFASSAHTDDSAAETDDAETSTSTDDEPTIRPARSDASSETQSLHSTETETETDEDEEERDMDEA